MAWARKRFWFLMDVYTLARQTGCLVFSNALLSSLIQEAMLCQRPNRVFKEHISRPRKRTTSDRTVLNHGGVWSAFTRTAYDSKSKECQELFWVRVFRTFSAQRFLALGFGDGPATLKGVSIRFLP